MVTTGDSWYNGLFVFSIITFLVAYLHTVLKTIFNILPRIEDSYEVCVQWYVFPRKDDILQKSFNQKH